MRGRTKSVKSRGKITRTKSSMFRLSPRKRIVKRPYIVLVNSKPLKKRYSTLKEADKVARFRLTSTQKFGRKVTIRKNNKLIRKV